MIDNLVILFISIVVLFSIINYIYSNNTEKFAGGTTCQPPIDDTNFLNNKTKKIISICKPGNIIEEPPKNYYFLLTTQHVTNVLATVRSRCLEIYLDLEKTNSNFIGDNIETELEKLFRDVINNKVDAYKISQLEKVVTHEEINQAIWAVIKNKPEVFEKLKFYLKNPFMPGSSKIALKSIYAALLNI